MSLTVSITDSERMRIAEVLAAIRSAVTENRMIKLPDFDPNLSAPAARFALTSVGLEPNDFGGTIDPYRYQFEGEEDLLHLIVTRQDSEPLSVEEARGVVALVVPEVPPAMLWLKPGEYSQHFYFGHDVLLSENRATNPTER